jgi:hypothetical protein
LLNFSFAIFIDSDVVMIGDKREVIIHGGGGMVMFVFMVGAW